MARRYRMLRADVLSNEEHCTLSSDTTSTSFMQALSRFSFILVACAICSVIVATSMPEYRELRSLENTLDDVKAMEAETLERMEQAKSERVGLQRDEEYLETRARDALDVALPGETIIRIERTED